MKALVIAIVTCVLIIPGYAKYGGGSGTAENPYQIWTPEQMNAIGAEPNDWDKHFRLMADIDLGSYTGTDFNIIGHGDHSFTGVFDGNGHTISNFTYTCTGRGYIGLFGLFGSLGLFWEKGEIKDLGLINPNVDAGTESCESGSLVGEMHNGTITNCYSEGGSVSRDNRVGGLVGEKWDGAIINCYSTASVSGDMCVGGLAGDNWDTITNCYAAGSVSGDWFVGGLVGCGLGEVANSFWDIETSGQTTSAGGTGKATTEMQMESTFTDPGWDFVGEVENGTEDIWSICEGTNYPRFVWRIPVGDFVCPDGLTILDFSFFATHWMDDNCGLSNDYCEGIDLDFSGAVEANDLEAFADNWLAGVQ